MPTNLPSEARRARKFPLVAMGVLVALCAIPVLALFTLGAFLSRDCKIESATDGNAGTSMVWRIETQRCGNGPMVSNVLLAPRGKSFALVASSTGTPRPIAVDRTPDGVTTLILEGNGGTEQTFALTLSATGRPKKPLVLANGRAKS